MIKHAYVTIFEIRYPNYSGSSEGESSSCGYNITSNTYIHLQKIQAETSLWNLCCCIAAYFAIIANILIGPLSDIFGRKKVFMISLIGTFGRSLGGLFAIHYKFYIYYFIAFYAEEGICGLWMCTLNTSHSYVADITGTGNQRLFGFALTEICFVLGHALGILASGYIISDLGFWYSMVILCFCIIVAIFIAAFILPETSMKTNRQQQSFSQNFSKTVSLYIDRSINRWCYVVCLSITLLVAFSNLGISSVDTMHVLNSPFCWSSVHVAWFATFRCAGYVFGIGSVLFLQLCLSDTNIAMLGSLSFIGSTVQEVFAQTDTVLFTVPITGAFSIMSMPVIRWIMSRMTHPDKQGAMFGGIAAVESVCGFAGPFSTKAIYQATVDIFPKAVFLVLGVLNIIVLILLLLLKFCSKPRVKSENTTECYSRMS